MLASPHHLQMHTCCCVIPPFNSLLHINRAGVQYNWHKMPDAKKAWISIVVAAGTTLLSLFPGLRLLKKNVEADLEAEAAEK